MLCPVATWRSSASTNACWSTRVPARAGWTTGRSPSSVTVAEAEGFPYASSFAKSAPAALRRSTSTGATSRLAGSGESSASEREATELRPACSAAAAVASESTRSTVPGARAIV